MFPGALPRNELHRGSALAFSNLNVQLNIVAHRLCWQDITNTINQPRVSILCNYDPKIVRPCEDLQQDLRQEAIDRVETRNFASLLMWVGARQRHNITKYSVIICNKV